MSRAIQLPFNSITFHGEKRITVDIPDAAIQQWCLELALLEKGLADAVAINYGNDTVELIVQKLDSDSELISRRARANWYSNRVELSLSGTELAMWVSFFLKYYRDGIGDVDHVDADISPAYSNQEDSITVTFKVSNAQAPIPGDELRKKLGLL